MRPEWRVALTAMVLAGAVGTLPAATAATAGAATPNTGGASMETGVVKRVGVVIEDKGVTWSRTLADPGEVAEVVAALAALPAAPTSSGPSCGAILAVPEVKLTLRGSSGTQVADDHTYACGGEQVALSGSDGATELLDGDAGGSSFREAVERLVGFGNELASATESGALLDALDASLHRASSDTVRDDSSPTPDLVTPASTSSMGEPSLTRTSWWTVPLSSGDVVAYLKAHEPDGYTTAGGGSWGTVSWGKIGGPMTTVADALLFGSSSDAYARPQIDIEVEDTATGSAVRADTYISPRAVPSTGSRVAHVSSIGVVDHTTTWGATVTTTTRRYAVTDQSTISRFAAALNSAPGVALYGGIWNCPSETAETRLVLTLRASTGDVVVRATDGACGWGAVSVHRDGVQQGPALDPAGLTPLLHQFETTKAAHR